MSEEVFEDGDPVIEVRIVPEILERALSSGRVVIENIDKYKIVTKDRSPSVSTKFEVE